MTYQKLFLLTSRNYFNSKSWNERYHKMLSDPDAMKKINEKKMKTYREHYGFDWSFQSPEVKAKMKKAMLEKYGVDNTKFLKDPNVDLSKSEFEIMQEHKYAAVFDSGTITWQWREK